METATNIEIQSIGGDMLNPHDNIVAIMVSFNLKQCGEDKVWITFRQDDIKVCGKQFSQLHGALKLFTPEDAKLIIEALNSVEMGRDIVNKHQLTEEDFIMNDKQS